jgi:hypothetical protein
MFLDEIDKKILKIFYNLKEDEYTGTKIITKFIFPDINKCALRSKEKTINYRIKRMSPSLIKIEKNSKGYCEYTLISANVKFCNYKFSNGKREALIINDNGKEIIFEI